MAHEIWCGKKIMEFARILCRNLFWVGRCSNLYEADHAVLIFGYQDALLFSRRDGQFLFPERLSAIEQARVVVGLGHEILIGALCRLLVNGADNPSIAGRGVPDAEK